MRITIFRAGTKLRKWLNHAGLRVMRITESPCITKSDAQVMRGCHKSVNELGQKWLNHAGLRVMRITASLMRITSAAT